MRKLFILCGIAGLGIGVFNACTKHEVIPPPVPLVDLNCECDASIADSAVSYKDSCYYSSQKNIVTGGTSTARYITNIEQEGLPGGLEIEIRFIEWIDGGSNNPTLDQWKTFLIDNPTPGFSDNSWHKGIAVRWTDPNGVVWTNDTLNTGMCGVNDAVFNTLIHEGDTTGEYVQFDLSFNTMLTTDGYPTVDDEDSVKCLTVGHARSAFRLE